MRDNYTKLTEIEIILLFIITFNGFNVMTQKDIY